MFTLVLYTHQPKENNLFNKNLWFVTIVMGDYITALLINIMRTEWEYNGSSQSITQAIVIAIAIQSMRINTQSRNTFIQTLCLSKENK